MKIAANFIVSLAALGALLTAPASQATDVAKLPLKAAVLAKPNVLFAYDDSISTDAEVMIDGNNQGYFYHYYGTAYGNTIGLPNGIPATGNGLPT
jgi:type IV pilus assembly protein PilY1